MPPAEAKKTKSSWGGEMVGNVNGSIFTLRYRLEQQVWCPGLAFLGTGDTWLSPVPRLAWAAHAAKASAGSQGLPDLSPP
jgi:hypothetical protein